MTDGLSWKAETTEQGKRFELSGEITENSDFAPLVSEPSETMIFDLADVAGVNSCGVRQWINFLSSLADNGKKVVMTRCSVAVVHQLNMVSNFRGTAAVTSAYAPYLCPSCKTEHSRLIDLAGGAPANFEEPIPCPSCGDAMEFDDLPEAYFSFRDY
jgi:anti-anti-sigma regulatory factor